MSIRRQASKTISDPLYGSISLTELEVRLINTQAFQRLRRIGQLGLADQVFPSADYSRFAHSIGACHVLGMVFDVLADQKGQDEEGVDDRRWQEHRVAMLLHDIGHYPMSHATEKAVEKHYKSEGISERDKEVSLDEVAYLNHEEVGGCLIAKDPEVSEILTSEGFDPEKIGRIFSGKEVSLLNNLVTSELDADRLDYLMRSSQATGLPYGNYDRDYIIKNLCFDLSGIVCLKAKALRSADHFLMCRAFDYLQTIFHKTLVGLEQMLQHCVRAALEESIVAMSDKDIVTAVENGEWLQWDDAWLRNQLLALERQTKESRPKFAFMAERIRMRRPPRCVWQHESLVPVKDGRRDDIKHFLRHAIDQD